VALPGATGEEDVSGANGVDADALGGEEAGEIFCVVGEGGLGGGVGERGGGGLDGGDGGDEEDGAIRGFALGGCGEVGGGGLGEADACKEISVEEADPLGLVLVPAGFAGAGAEVGDEVVDLSKAADGEVEGVLDGFGVGEVSGDGEDAVVEVGGGGELFVGAGEGVDVAACEDDAGAFGEEGGGNGSADAAGGAGDEGDLVGELEVHGFSLVGGGGREADSSAALLNEKQKSGNGKGKGDSRLLRFAAE